MTESATPIRSKWLTAAQVAHGLAIGVGLIWLAVVASRGERDFNGVVMPWWAITVWAISFIVMAWAPRWPALGLVIFAALATLVARYEPGINVARNTDVMDWIVLQSITAALVWSVRNRMIIARPPLRSWVTWLAIALCAWIAIASIAVRLRTGQWNPSAEHHPRQFVQNLAVFLLATQFLTSRGAALALCVVMPLCLTIRGRFLSPHGVWLQEDIASLLVITLPLCLMGVSAFGPRRWRGAVIAGFALLAAHNLWLLYATQNRGAAVALGVVLVTLWLVLPRRWIGALLAVPIAMVAVTVARRGGFWARFTSLFSGGTEANSANERLQLWRAGLRMGTNHPILGIGPGHFTRYVQKYDPAIRRDLPAHNHLIEMFAESGVPGALLFITLFGGVIVLLWRVSIMAQRDWPGPGARLLIPCLMAYLTIGAFITRHDLALAYLLAGWAVGMHNALMGHDIIVARD